MRSARIECARAIQTAKAEAYEEAANVAEEIGIYRVSREDRVLMIPVDIATAIRKLVEGK